MAEVSPTFCGSLPLNFSYPSHAHVIARLLFPVTLRLLQLEEQVETEDLWLGQ